MTSTAASASQTCSIFIVFCFSNFSFSLLFCQEQKELSHDYYINPYESVNGLVFFFYSTSLVRALPGAVDCSGTKQERKKRREREGEVLAHRIPLGTCENNNNCALGNFPSYFSSSNVGVFFYIQQP